MNERDYNRIMSHVHMEPMSGCWLWAGTAPDGYGRTCVNDKSVLVHRVVYEHHRGPVGQALDIDHKCRTTQCCNPDHLEAVTHQVNMLRGKGFARRQCPEDALLPRPRLDPR